METEIKKVISMIDVLLASDGLNKKQSLNAVKNKLRNISSAKITDAFDFVAEVILKNGYRACCGKELSENAVKRYIEIYDFPGTGSMCDKCSGDGVTYSKAGIAKDCLKCNGDGVLKNVRSSA